MNFPFEKGNYADDVIESFEFLKTKFLNADCFGKLIILNTDLLLDPKPQNPKTPKPQIKENINNLDL